MHPAKKYGQNGNSVVVDGTVRQYLEVPRPARPLQAQSAIPRRISRYEAGQVGNQISS